MDMSGFMEPNERHNRENKPEALEHLVQAAQTEFVRVERAAAVGLDTRLRLALCDQDVPLGSAIDSALSLGLRIAFGVMSLIALQSVFWMASGGFHDLTMADWSIERWVLGV